MGTRARAQKHETSLLPGSGRFGFIQPSRDDTRLRYPEGMSDEQAIRAVIAEWLRASAVGDFSTMLTLLADDMVFLVPGQAPFGKNEFKAAWEGPMQGAKVSADCDVEEILISGDLGFTRTRLGVEITTPDGKTSRAKGNTMTLFRRQPDGRWLLARDANLLTPQA